MPRKKKTRPTLPGTAGIPVFRAQACGGKLVFELPHEVESYLGSLDGLLLEVAIREERPCRSLNQNAYYWWVVLGSLEQHTGHSDEDLHEICRRMFLQRVGEDGNEYVASTASLSPGEFEAYLEDIRRWAAMFLGLVIPDPKKLVAA